jgi:MFS family permease
LQLTAVAPCTPQGIGPLYAGWTADALGWRWVMWIMVILFGAIFAAACLVLKETRGSYILSQRAMRLTKETGRLHAAPVRCLHCSLISPSRNALTSSTRVDGLQGDTERADLRTMITQSISRPLVYLTTEPIVGAISVWVGA